MLNEIICTLYKPLEDRRLQQIFLVKTRITYVDKKRPPLQRIHAIFCNAGWLQRSCILTEGLAVLLALTIKNVKILSL